MNADNPSDPGAPASEPPPLLDENPSVPQPPPQPILLDNSMLDAPPCAVERRREFEDGMSYLQPVTLGIILLLTVIFGFELAGGALESLETIVAAGALKRANVLAGEAWRLLSAVFLHGSIDHVIGNCLCLYVLGMAVEHAYGRLKLMAVFLLSGLTGSLLSFSLSEGPSVGASGAIFGLIGCVIGFFYRFHDKVYFREKRLGGVLLVWVAYSVITGFLTPLIDNWAHIGGLVGGAGTALFLQPRRTLLESPHLIQ